MIQDEFANLKVQRPPNFYTYLLSKVILIVNLDEYICINKDHEND